MRDSGSITASERFRSALKYPGLFIVLQSILYGFGDPVSKYAYDSAPLYTVLTLRYFTAFAVLACICGKKVIRDVRRVPVKCWLIPGMCIALNYILNNISLTLTEATSVAFLRSLSTVFTPAVAFLIYRTRYRWQHIAIQLLVVAGLYMLCARGGLSGFGTGEVLTLISAVLMAGALVFSMHYLEEDIDPLSLTALQTGCSLILAFGCSFIFEGGISVQTVSPAVFLIILYLGLACTLLGYFLQNKALEKISDRSVALLQCICPVMTAFFSFLILGEKLNLTGIIGAAVIILCVALETRIQE